MHGERRSSASRDARGARAEARLWSITGLCQIAFDCGSCLCFAEPPSSVRGGWELVVSWRRRRRLIARRCCFARTSRHCVILGSSLYHCSTRNSAVSLGHRSTHIRRPQPPSRQRETHDEVMFEGEAQEAHKLLPSSAGREPQMRIGSLSGNRKPWGPVEPLYQTFKPWVWWRLRAAECTKASRRGAKGWRKKRPEALVGAG